MRDAKRERVGERESSEAKSAESQAGGGDGSVRLQHFGRQLRCGAMRCDGMRACATMPCHAGTMGGEREQAGREGEERRGEEADSDVVIDRDSCHG